MKFLSLEITKVRTSLKQENTYVDVGIVRFLKEASNLRTTEFWFTKILY